jgi:diguanylate cyclase (GGDEF)-like protein
MSVMEVHEPLRLVLLTGDDSLEQVLARLAAERPKEPMIVSRAGDGQRAIASLTKANQRGAFLFDLRAVAKSPVNQLGHLPMLSRAGPVVALVDSDKPSAAGAAIEAGAIDTITFEDLSASLLRRSVRYALARRDAEQKLARLSLFDPVTGLASQALYWEILGLAVRRAKRNRDFFAVMLVQVDNLPGSELLIVSERDEVLRTLAERVTSVMRGSDTVARFEAEQIAVLAESMPRVEDVQIVAEKIIQELGKPFPAVTAPMRIGCTIGISLYPTSAGSAEALISRASDALGSARERGENQFAFA